MRALPAPPRPAAGCGVDWRLFPLPLEQTASVCVRAGVAGAALTHGASVPCPGVSLGASGFPGSKFSVPCENTGSRPASRRHVNPSDSRSGLTGLASWQGAGRGLWGPRGRLGEGRASQTLTEALGGTSVRTSLELRNQPVPGVAARLHPQRSEPTHPGPFLRGKPGRTRGSPGTQAGYKMSTSLHASSESDVSESTGSLGRPAGTQLRLVIHFRGQLPVTVLLAGPKTRA